MEEQRHLTTGNYKEKTDTDESRGYLAPDQLPQPKKNTPHPLLQVQRLAAERLPSKLHDHNLHRKKHKPINSIPPSLLRTNSIFLNTCFYLHRKGTKNNRTEDGVPKDAIKDVPLPVDFPGIYFIEELHHDKGVEYDGVVFRWRRVEGSVTSTVNVKDLLTYTKGGRGSFST